MTAFSNPKTAGIGQAGTGREFVTDFTLATGTTSLSEQILKQYTIPAGLFTGAAYHQLRVLWAKTGGTDNSTLRVRLGTTGTTADTSIWSATFGAATRSGPTSTSMFAATSTQLRLLTATFVFGFETGAFSTAAYPNNVTVTDMAANTMILSLSQTLVGTTDTPQIAHVILTLF